jgi:hypothetical protein
MSRFVVAADWDKRYDSGVRARAEQVDFQDMKEAERQRAEGHDYLDRSGDICSNVHPCILNDIFRSLIKMEQEQVNLPDDDQASEDEQDEGAEI